jgi:hypothetical protein
MALPLKTAGMAELSALRKRVKRQQAMERIDPQPATEILTHIDQIESIIQTMREEGEDGD